MTIDNVTDFMALAILVEMAAAILSLGYVVGVYVRSPRGSTIFKMLVSSDVIKVAAGLWIGFLAVYRLTNNGISSPSWTVPISAFVVAVLLAPPILHALTFRRLRRRYGDSTPPPFHDGD